MNKDYYAIAIITFTSILLLLIFVKKDQIREAFLALLIAQLFSWPITLIYVSFGFQINPVRLFPQATDSNFLFAFIFQPSVFTIYYLYYPKQSSLIKRFFYSLIITGSTILIYLLVDLYTNLIHYPKKSVLIWSFLLIFMLYNISRIYIDWFFRKAFCISEE